MDEVVQTIPVLARWVLYISGFIAALGGAWAVIDKLRTPTKRQKAEIADMKTTISNLKSDIAELKRHHDEDQKVNDAKFQSDLKALEELTDSNRHMCGAMLALLDHMISGNSVDKMKEVRDEMRKFIIEKS